MGGSPHRFIRIAAVTALLAIPSCAPPEAPGAVVRMDFARSVSIFDAPFPSADLVDADGIVRLDGLPAGGRIAIVDQVHHALVGLHGFGTTSAIHFQLTEAPDTTMIPHRVPASDTSAVVQIIDVDPDSPDLGTRVPLELFYADDAGPFGAHAHLLTALPTQGWPLRADTFYAVVIDDALLTTTGNRFTPSASMRALRAGRAPEGMSAAAGGQYVAALMQLRAHHVDVDHVVGMSVFRTQDPTAVLSRAIASARARDVITFDAAFTLDTTYPDYCVFHTTAHVPVYQTGTPPYSTTGGTWSFDQTGALVLDHTEQATVLLTLPRRRMPTDGFPLVTLVRTGAGGDRPLVDRGIEPVRHSGATPGTGPAMHFAAEGIAGIQIDGPHGGLRNITHMDEQFLVFNIQNPGALRDNLRQSALELDLLVDAIGTIEVDTASCPGLSSSSGRAHIDTRNLALMGHSMGASIAPLAAAFEPRYRAIILSGAGASWLENVLYKQSPLPVRTIAQGYLGYTGAVARTLREDDPVVNWLQWAGEEADAAVYAPLLIRHAGGQPRHILMFQGIIDTYIMPPIANSLTIATGLDLAGPALDRSDPLLSSFQSVLDVLPLRGRMPRTFPVSANLPVPGGGTVTAAVVQHTQDGIEDGHEVMWQLPAAQTQYRCFLRTFLRDPAPSIVDPSVGCP